jgi:KUP system potassium uptake protein
MILGAVFLAITGAEVLYADLGHFGRKPIRSGWFCLVLPCLLLNYFGQAACLLRNPGQPDNLFYRTAPEWALYPLVILATFATVIASQAVISGTFSLARQAFQFGFWPRMRIVHTSDKSQGQIYMPDISLLLLIGTVTLVFGFKSSGNLASAYGIAVSGTMLTTTILAIIVARKVWKLPLWLVIPAGMAFLSIDSSFFLSCMTKIASGGWIPIAIAVAIFMLSGIWRQGRTRLAQYTNKGMFPIDKFVEDLRRTKPVRVKGCAVFLSGNPHGVPRILLHNMKHNRVLHEVSVVLCVHFEDVPRIPDGERYQVEILGEGLYRVTLHFGFSESPDVPDALKDVRAGMLDLGRHNISYFLGRESLSVSPDKKGMALWRKNIFGFLSRNSSDASKYFNIPPDRLTEFGIGVEL